MAHLRKITISVPPGLVDQLDYISGRLGVSRSALMADMLSEPLGVVVELFQKLPENPNPVDQLRFRGDSAQVVRDRLAQLSTLANGLFSEEGPSE